MRYLKNMNLKTIKLFFILILCTFSLFSKEKKGLDFNGKMYSELGILQTYDADEKDDVNFTGKSILSIGLKNRNRKYGKIEALFDLILPYGSSILEYAPSYLDSSNSEMSNMIEMFSFGKSPLLLDIRKLYLSMYLPFMDITLGRQIINFGKGVVFSPVDVFSFVELSDINFRKSGSDIANVKIPLGDLSGVDITVELPFLNEGFSSAAKVFTTVSALDLSLLAIYKKAEDESGIEDEVLAGVTFKGDLEVGLYGETALHFLTDSKKTYFEGMLGIDYSVNGKWIFAIEYLYKHTEWKLSNWGEHNLFGTLQFVINDLSNISGSIIYDIEHRSTLGTLQFFYNILQNVNTVFYVQGIDSDIGTYMKYSARAEVKF